MASWIEFYQMTTPILAMSPSRIIQVDAVPMYDKIDPVTGHWLDALGNDALVSPIYGLDISKSKQVEFVQRAGIASGNTAYVDRALLAAEAVLSFKDPMTIDGVFYDGDAASFPGMKFGTPKKNSRFHNKTICLNNVARQLLILGQSSFAAEYAGRLERATSDLMAVARWCLNSDDMRLFFKDLPAQCNQLLSVACFMQAAGALGNDDAMKLKAQEQVQIVFDKNSSDDGVLWEKIAKDGIGFDGSYQVFSLEMLGDYYVQQPPGLWADEVFGQLERATLRWLKTCNPATGLISDVGWTRCEEKIPREPGAFPVDTDRDIISYRLQWLAYLGVTSGDPDNALVDIGCRVLAQGQSFTHLGRGNPWIKEIDLTLDEWKLDLAYGSA